MTWLDLAGALSGLAVLLIGVEDLVAPRQLENYVRPRLIGRALRRVTLGSSLIALGILAAVTSVVSDHAGLVVTLAVCIPAIVLRMTLLGGIDGSDWMLAFVLLALLSGRLIERGAPRTKEAWALSAILLIGWSYVESGLAKVSNPAWRSGRAVGLIMNVPGTGHRALARLLLRRRTMAAFGSWCVMTIELGALPLFTLGGIAAMAEAAALVIMHLFIAITMRLPRFLWVFAAALATVLSARAAL